MNEGRLTRRLGVFGATMLGLGSIVGTGIFVSIGIAAGVAGPAVILAIVLAAGLAACNALSSAQLAARWPVSGGTYEYGYRLLHPAIYYAITNLAALRLPRELRLYPPFVAWLGLGGCLFLTPFLPVRIWMTGIALIVAGLLWQGLAGRLWPRAPAQR